MPAPSLSAQPIETRLDTFDGLAPQPLHLPAGVVSAAPVLAALHPEQRTELLRHSSKRRYRRGDWIVRQGDRNQQLHLLLSGRAHMLRADVRHREVIIDLIRPGEHFGEMALIDNQPCSRSVRSVLTSDVLHIDGPALARILPMRPELSATLMHGLVQRLRRARRQIASLALYDVEGRVLRLLHDMAESGQHGEQVLRERLSRLEIARMVGASREMVSRIMAELESQGVLRPLPDGSVLLMHDDQP